MAPDTHVRMTEIKRRRGRDMPHFSVGVRLKRDRHNLTHGFEFAPEIRSHNTFVAGQTWGDAPACYT